MTRPEHALWERAYRIADAAMRRECRNVGRHQFNDEGDPLAAHLLAEAIVQFASAPEGRAEGTPGAGSNADHSGGKS